MSASDVVKQIQTAVAASQPDSLSMIQGVVSSVDYTTTPPVVSAYLSGASTVTGGIRFCQGYTPRPNDVVQVLKQNNSLLIVDTIWTDPGATAATGWISPGLTSGVSTQGGAGGPVKARLVIDHGMRKVQFQGSVSMTGTPASIMTLGSASPTFRPGTFRRIATFTSLGADTLTITTGGVIAVGNMSALWVSFDGVEYFI